jgi:deoxyribose-phosphate aldolase
VSAAAERAIRMLDLTDLGEAATGAGAEALCRRAAAPAPGRPDLHVAAVCLWPRFVALARAALGDGPVRVATVANFPSGAEPAAAVAAEIRRAVADGADEIDVVLDHAALARGEEAAARAGLAAAREAAGAGLLKVILETGALARPELIGRAAALAIEHGADMLKTSTGKVPVGASPKAVAALLRAAKAAPRVVGVKVSGGVRTPADAARYLGLADEIMGPAWASPETFRIGASSLLDALVLELDGAGRGG